MIKVIIITLLLSLTFFLNHEIKAQDCNGSVEERISCYTDNISKLQASGKTLSSQIAQFDAQIKLTSLKITQTEEQINLLSGRIDQLEGSLTDLTKSFNQRVVETYKMTRVEDPLLLILSSNNLGEAFNRFSYLKKIQESDRSLLKRLTSAKDTYAEEKVDQEDLQNKLALQKKQLDTQKAAKANLLTVTRNDEKKYQSLLSQALAEKAAIEKALVSGTKVGPVKAGDPIALVGNSGWHQDDNKSCSTGKHLHFEIRKNNSWVEPGPYISSHSVRNCQDYNCSPSESPHYVNLGGGSWRWPLEDPIWVTQFYGHTPYSYRYKYSGGIHTGWDLVPKTSDVIRAPADGNLFKYSTLCVVGGNYINIVYIEHGDNVISFYLHVQ